jgi:hypothetical protein
MEYLKEGDFVRTKMENSNVLIGGLLMVDDVEGTQVYVHHVPKNSIGSFARLRSRLKKLKCIKLQLPVDDLEWLIKNRPSVITHPSTKRWEDAIDKTEELTSMHRGKYDVTVFYNPHSKISVVVTEPIFWNPYRLSSLRPKEKKVAARWNNIYVI